MNGGHTSRCHNPQVIHEHFKRGLLKMSVLNELVRLVGAAQLSLFSLSLFGLIVFI